MNRNRPGLLHSTSTPALPAAAPSPPHPHPSFVLTLSRCNILALIKANKGSKKNKTFRNRGGEEDVSRRTRQFAALPLPTINLERSDGRAPVLTSSPTWLQRSSRRAALLLLTATVPNSTLRWSTSMACAIVQYQFGPLKGICYSPGQ